MGLRFSLQLGDGREANSLKGLKEFFLEDNVATFKAILILLNKGTLVRWLKNSLKRNDLAERINELSVEDSRYIESLCEILDFEYNDSLNDLYEEWENRSKKLDKLKEYCDEEKATQIVDAVAFISDDIIRVIDSGATTIYLCGDEFIIPLEKTNVQYVGINNPVVRIKSDEIVDFKEKGIAFKDIQFDEKYQAEIYLKEIAGAVGKRIRDLSREIFKKYMPYVDQSYGALHLNALDNRTSAERFALIADKLSSIDFDSVDLSNELESEDMSVINEAKTYGADDKTAMKIAKFTRLVKNIDELLYPNLNRKIKLAKTNSITSKLLRSNALAMSQIIPGFVSTETPTEIIADLAAKNDYVNPGLALIFDYNSANQFARAIMDNAHLLFNYDSQSEERFEIKYADLAVSSSTKSIATKRFVNLCRSPLNKNEKLYFIFWALMILLVDDTRAQENLSLLCDFIVAMGLEESYIPAIINVIKTVLGVPVEGSNDVKCFPLCMQSVLDAYSKKGLN